MYGAIFFALNVVAILPDVAQMSECDKNFFLVTGIIVALILSAYLGSQGRKMWAKYHLKKWYVFEMEDSELVSHYKARWTAIIGVGWSGKTRCGRRKLSRDSAVSGIKPVRVV